jgi:hypothetical protein
MGRRKHAWTAYEYSKESESENKSDLVWRAARAVEGAVVEDFTDAVFERLGELEDTLNLNSDVKLGYELAMRELRNTYLDWTSNI